MSVKFLISQKPMIAHFFFPGNIGSIFPNFLIEVAIISLPATPKLRASKTPILFKVSSISIIS